MSTPPPIPPPLPWSTRLAVFPTPSPSLSGDKLYLPQSALEQLLSAASLAPRQTSDTSDDPWAAAARPQPSSDQLPHPMIVKLTNPHTRISTYGVPREFSAEEGEVVVSPFLWRALGLDLHPSTAADDEEDEVVEVTANGTPITPSTQLAIEAASLPKGTKVRLRPLEAGYDDEDWKAILERYLREGFATVAEGMVLEVPRGHGRKGVWRFLVDQALPTGFGGVCIIDTDLEVDIEPLDEEQARETLRTRAARKAAGGKVKVEEEVSGRVEAGEEQFWELEEWEKGKPLEIVMEVGEEVEEGRDVDVMVVTDKQHHKPRIDEYIWGDLGSVWPKRIQVEPTNVGIEGAGKIIIGIRGWRSLEAEEGAEEDGEPREYTLRITQSAAEAASSNTLTSTQSDTPPSPDHARCPNCHQWIPTRTLPLHTSFCARNNIPCPHPNCTRIFLRTSPALKTHWHCDLCPTSGDLPSSHHKHNQTHHTVQPCPACDSQHPSLPALALHRTTLCPAKLILCPFCHLLVPQSSPPASSLLPSAHEISCGSRTTECDRPGCGRRIRLRDLDLHLQSHELDRLDASRNPTPRICANENCYRSKGGNALGLCEVCYGPLYAPVNDPDGSALRGRLERRLLKQMMVGCGRKGCANAGACKTAAAAAGTGVGRKWTMAEAKEVVKGMVGEGRYRLCVDAETERRRSMAEGLRVESCVDENAGRGGYVWEWCCRAVEVAGGKEEDVRRWVEANGVREGERD